MGLSLTQVCPSCNAALDPTHAPVARVRAGRVVTYCSIECANQANTGALVAPKPSEYAKPEAEPAAAKAGGDALAKAASTGKGSSASSASTQASSGKKRAAAVATADQGGERMLKKATSKSSSGRRTKVLFASAAIMLGGMGLAVIQAVSPATPSTATASHVDARASEQDVAKEASASEPAAKPVPSAALLRAAAIKELEIHLQGNDSRFERLAGIALARIQHPEAVKHLSALLGKEDSELSRIDIAYGMALGGDPAGKEHLVAELKSSRRDVRIDAARRLAQLGDDAGRNTLVQMLGIRSHRLGAATVLALLGDEQGLEALRTALTDESESAENRMRAAVGLGRAKDDSARAFLLEILNEGRYVVDAAGALAALGDKAAVPALERQLELTAMRVEAAESLHSMAAEVDLRPIAASMTNANEEGRIAAAEAILILTPAQADGP